MRRVIGLDLVRTSCTPRRYTHHTMTAQRRERLIQSLAYHLSGIGFRNIRSRGLHYASPLPLECPIRPVEPDLTTRSSNGKLEVYFVRDVDELQEGEHVEYVRHAVKAAEHHGVRLWIAVPNGERERARERLQELDVAVRLLQV